VTPVPGPSAVVAAVTGSGLKADAFYFAGFLPARRSQRRKSLEEIKHIAVPVVIYEAPHRIIETLADACETLGTRHACLARELTKLHEEWLFGTLEEIAAALKGRDRILGEITLIIAGGSRSDQTTNFPDTITDHLQSLMQTTGQSQKEALKAAARQRGISRREAYQMLLKEKEN
jgi:16S rRNA (cytidine1402-2'-O)-methyltransferase